VGLDGQNLSPQPLNLTLGGHRLDGQTVASVDTLSLEVARLRELDEENLAEQRVLEVEESVAEAFQGVSDDDRYDFDSMEAFILESGQIQIHFNVTFSLGDDESFERVSFISPEVLLGDDFSFSALVPFSRREILVIGSCRDGFEVCRNIVIEPFYFLNDETKVRRQFRAYRMNNQSLEVVSEEDYNEEPSVLGSSQLLTQAPALGEISLAFQELEFEISASPSEADQAVTSRSSPELVEPDLDSLDVQVIQAQDVSADVLDPIEVRQSPHPEIIQADALRPVEIDEVEVLESEPVVETLQPLEARQSPHPEVVEREILRPIEQESRVVLEEVVESEPVQVRQSPHPDVFESDDSRPTQITTDESPEVFFDTPTLSSSIEVDSAPSFEQLEVIRPNLPELVPLISPEIEEGSLDIGVIEDEPADPLVSIPGTAIISPVDEREADVETVIDLNSGAVIEVEPEAEEVLDPLLNDILNKNYNQSKGSYSNGYIENAQIIPREILGVVVNPERESHQWASGLSVDFITYIGQEFMSLNNDNLFCVNNLSLENGGNTPSSESHENGLELDVSYPSGSNNCTRRSDFYKTWQSLLSNDEQFFERNWNFLKLILDNNNLSQRVDMIFTDREFMVSICNWAKEQNKDSETLDNILSKLYHKERRDKHYQIRLVCNTQNSGCSTEEIIIEESRVVDSQTCD